MSSHTRKMTFIPTRKISRGVAKRRIHEKGISRPCHKQGDDSSYFADHWRDYVPEYIISPAR